MKKFVASIAAGIMIAGVTVSSVSAQEHEVQSGESLWKIANEYNTTIDELVKINQLKTTVIHPKQVIQIDEEDKQDTYTVEKGDTLGKIGNKFGVTVAELKAWNNLNTDVIVVGQVLTLNGEQVAQEAAPVEKVSTETTSEEAKAEPAKEEANTQEKAEPAKEEANTQEKAEPAKEQTETQEKAEGKTISVTATAYTANCGGCSGVTATGVDLNSNPNAKVIAVDPNVIPLGSKVYVEGYGYATAADTGGAIKGNKIDVHMATNQEALNWGNRTVNVTIVD